MKRKAKCKCVVVHRGPLAKNDLIAIACGKSSAVTLRRKLGSRRAGKIRRKGARSTIKTTTVRCNAIGRAAYPLRKA